METQNTGLAPPWFKQYNKDATGESWFEYYRGPDLGTVPHTPTVAPAGRKGKTEAIISLTEELDFNGTQMTKMPFDSKGVLAGGTL